MISNFPMMECTFYFDLFITKTKYLPEKSLH